MTEPKACRAKESAFNLEKQLKAATGGFALRTTTPETASGKEMRQQLQESLGEGDTEAVALPSRRLGACPSQSPS